jgi:hypothetical protein
MPIFMLDSNESGHNPLYYMKFQGKVRRQTAVKDFAQDSQFKWQEPSNNLNLTANSQIMCKANYLISLNRESYN